MTESDEDHATGFDNLANEAVGKLKEVVGEVVNDDELVEEGEEQAEIAEELREDRQT